MVRASAGILKECKLLEHRQIRLMEGEFLDRILVYAEQSETVLDFLERYHRR